MVEVRMEIYKLIDGQSFSQKKTLDGVIEDLKFLIPYERKRHQEEQERLARQEEERKRIAAQKAAEMQAVQQSASQPQLVPFAAQIINGQLNISVPGNWFNANMNLGNLYFIIKACVYYNNTYYTVVQHPQVPVLRLAFYALNGTFGCENDDRAKVIIDYCSQNGIFG